MLLTILETVAVAMLVLFNGVLDSKYYERLRIKAFSEYMWYPVGCLLVATFLTALADVYTSWGWLVPALMVAHSLLHIIVIIMLTIALIKFKEIPFRYSIQYLYARATLRFAVLFEVFAFCAYELYCVKMMCI